MVPWNVPALAMNTLHTNHVQNLRHAVICMDSQSGLRPACRTLAMNTLTGFLLTLGAHALARATVVVSLSGTVCLSGLDLLIQAYRATGYYTYVFFHNECKVKCVHVERVESYDDKYLSRRS